MQKLANGFQMPGLDMQPFGKGKLIAGLERPGYSKRVAGYDKIVRVGEKWMPKMSG